MLLLLWQLIEQASFQPWVLLWAIWDLSQLIYNLCGELPSFVLSQSPVEEDGLQLALLGFRLGNGYLGLLWW